MKQFLLKTVLFLLILGGLNILFLFLIRKVDLGFAKSYAEVGFTNKNFEYLFLGNSLTLDAIDAEYLSAQGFRSYNMAMAGASLRTNYVQLTKYLEKNIIPRVVVLGLSSSVTRSFDDTTLNPIAEYNYGYMNWSKISSIPFFKFKWLATEVLKRGVSPDHRKAYIAGGQMRINRKVPDNTLYRDTPDNKLDSTRYINSRYLGAIVSLCKAKNIRFLLVEMPGYKNTQNDLSLGPHFITFTTNDIKVEMFNLNNRTVCASLFDSQNDWLGNSHLNIYGATKLSHFFAVNILGKL